MSPFKIGLAILMVFAISNSIVESCNSDTGTASGSCSAGTKGLDCSDNCPCNKTGLLTCIENKCFCNLNSQGGFGSSCNDDCPCQKSLGLLCDSGTCKCNSTAALWDTDKCYNIESDEANCDALIVETVPARKKRALVGTQPFKTDASEKGWKCVASTKTLYGPSYSELTSKGKYIYQDVAALPSAASGNCSSLKAERAQPSAGDALETLLKAYSNVLVLIGVSKDNRDGKFYYDNKTASALTLDDDTIGGCVTLASDGEAVTYTSADCATEYMYICQI